MGHTRAVRAISTGVEHDACLACADGAVLAKALAQPDLARMTRAPAEEGFLARKLHAYRLAGLSRQQCTKELGLKQILLGTETTAHVIDNHPHLVQRQTQHLGQGATHHEGGLGRDPHCQLALTVTAAVPFAGADIRLHIGRGRPPHAVFALDDHLCFGKTALNVTPGIHRRRYHQIATRTHRMDLRRIRLHGVFDGEHCRQRLVGNLDQIDSLLRDLLAHRCHCSHALAPVAHRVIENVLVARHRRRTRMRRAVVQHPRYILMRQYRLDPGQGQRLADINAENAGMRDVRALETRMQHAGQGQVAGIHRLSGDLADHIGTLDAVADDGKVLLRWRSRGAHAASPRSWRAAALTASMILV